MMIPPLLVTNFMWTNESNQVTSITSKHLKVDTMALMFV